MNNSSSLAQAVDPNPTRRATWLTAMRVAWVVFALLVVGIVSIGSVIRYREQRQVCTASATACFEAQRLTLSKLAGITDIEKALQFHALFFLIVNGLGRIICWSIAFLLFWRRSDDWMALLVGVYLLIVGNTGPQIYAANAYPFLWPLANLLTILSNAIFGLFFCIFPNGRFVPRWSRWLALLGGIYAIASPWLEFPQGPPFWFTIGFFMLYAASVYVQVYRYRNVSTAVERQQTKWVVYGVVLWVLFSVTTDLFVIFGPPRDAPISPRSYVTITGFNLTVLAIPVCLSIAILRHRLFDIDLLINRTFVYGALTVFVVGAYALVVDVVGVLLRVEGNIILSLITTGLVALAFNPLRERLQRGVNRLMYGQRDEPYAVLVRLGQRLEAAFEPSAVLPSIVETVAKTLNLPYVAIATVEHGELSIKSEWRAPDAISPMLDVSPITIPLFYQNEPLGELRVSPRRGETTLAEADRRLLADLAQQASVAVHGVRLMNDLRDLTADLQGSRERLVSAREEERRRLRRDLHDDLAPTLAGLALTANTIADLIPADPAKATALANDLNQSTRAAVSDIRRLVYDLRPPTLDELGLVAAIRERAAQFTHSADGLLVTVEADELPPLPAAVEVAAYRIAQEALMNVARHARAKTCHIRLALDDDCLHLEITDDGLGLTEPRTAGVGLHSMQERAAELGGTCVIERGLNGGTCVRVSLPLSKVTHDEPAPNSDC